LLHAAETIPGVHVLARDRCELRHQARVQPALELRFILAMTGETLLMEERRDAAHEKLLRFVIRPGRRHQDPTHGNQKSNDT
jgi:hypothetical protein